MSKIHIVILIVVFVVLHIQAADDNVKDKHTMKCLSDALIRRRITAAEMTKIAQDYRIKLTLSEKRHIKDTLKKRQAYVPANSPLTPGQFSQDPDPGNSEMRLTYVMQYNAYQYESCKALHVKVLNTLAQEASSPQSRNSLLRRPKQLLDLMKYYLTLEVRYAIALGEVAPHFQTLFPTRNEARGNVWGTSIDEVRDKRVFFARLIDAMKANKILVSLNDTTNDSALRLKYSPFSMEELSTEPTSDMSDERLHYVLEYNALMFEKFRFKSVQLKKVIDDVPMNPKLRQALDNRQKRVHATMRTYFGTARMYADKMKKTAPRSRQPDQMFDLNELPPETDDPIIVPENQRTQDHVIMETYLNTKRQYAKEVEEAAPHGHKRRKMLDLNELPFEIDNPIIVSCPSYHEPAEPSGARDRGMMPVMPNSYKTGANIHMLHQSHTYFVGCSSADASHRSQSRSNAFQGRSIENITK
ncbi:hypothetical protein SeMB42_g02585 [Synchytrium endobioticum]|uniref:Uncharacterized protein n=1 Tax=Synchytrium endobioticum TaxID=286115 RepID=A0A507DGV9_9FUNG|nr:hypothetical protein SeMB42_g02585 [Synchytrium endobioticum]TPX50912.1 hypothetical protein SeLEV6574_g00638 [Synchytrium endobioticum]